VLKWPHLEFRGEFCSSKGIGEASFRATFSARRLPGEKESVGLVSSFAMGASELQGTIRDLARLRSTAFGQVCLPEMDRAEHVTAATRRGAMCNDSLE